jgi:hypothetical protein
VTCRYTYIFKKEAKRGLAPNAQKVKSLSGCYVNGEQLPRIIYVYLIQQSFNARLSLPESQCIFYAAERETFPAIV